MEDFDFNEEQFIDEDEEPFDFDEYFDPYEEEALDEEEKMIDELGEVYTPDTEILELRKGDKLRKMKENRTSKYLTKFEKSRVLGFRALNLSLGSDSTVKTDEIDPYKIAKLELYNKVMPVKIRRYISKNEYEEWDVNELILL